MSRSASSTANVTTTGKVTSMESSPCMSPEAASAPMETALPTVINRAVKSDSASTTINNMTSPENACAPSIASTSVGTCGAVTPKDHDPKHSSTIGSSTDQKATDDDRGSTVAGRKPGHRRQESMYTMTGLYGDNVSEEECPALADDGQEGGIANPALSASGQSLAAAGVAPTSSAVLAGPSSSMHEAIYRCHSRNPSAGLDRERTVQHSTVAEQAEAALRSTQQSECGILNCRPSIIQKFAGIKYFVFLLSLLVTLQQALSSGYINSVITTIEKRFEIPSSLSGLIASSYEIGNVITVIFVSYLGSRRHIPVWIGVGAVIMGLGSLVFMLPHFIAEENYGVRIPTVNGSGANGSAGDDANMCQRLLPTEDIGGLLSGVGGDDRGMSMVVDQLGRLSSAGLAAPPLSHHHTTKLRGGDNCIRGTPSTTGPVLVFVLAQLLLGCGGSPLFTLGTTYVDNHVKAESSSIYIGCMYSMAAFGPVLGFLLGAYLLSFHMDSLSHVISIDQGDHRWVGMWWGGFLLGGLLLIVIAIPFFSFPKDLNRGNKDVIYMEKTVSGCSSPAAPCGTKKDSAYGKTIKDIPRSMWKLACNPIYMITCLGACMELIIVSGFVVFLPKYLETQFSLGKSQASVFTGSIAIPGACIGIFMGGCILKRMELRPKGAVQFVVISNFICLICYALLFFLGCDNLKMAGTTIPYFNNSHHAAEPFQVNLTSSCNFGCECRMNDVEPVCGNNGLTYFSPCHAGCTSILRSNYTNCACIHANVTLLGGPVVTLAARSDEYAEVTVVPVATAGPCNSSCKTIYPFLILLFFMTFIVAITQMPLLMIVLRSVNEEEKSFALGMQFVIFRLFGYIPAPILFGNLIDSTCILWKSTCGENAGRCLLYDIEQFRYKYVGLCAIIKIIALVIFLIDWWLVRRRKHLDDTGIITTNEILGSIVSLDNISDEKINSHRRTASNVSTQSASASTSTTHHHNQHQSHAMQTMLNTVVTNNLTKTRATMVATSAKSGDADVMATTV